MVVSRHMDFDAMDAFGVREKVLSLIHVGYFSHFLDILDPLSLEFVCTLKMELLVILKDVNTHSHHIWI